MNKFSDKDIARFWSSVNVGDEDECWTWSKKCLIRGGYGQFGVGGRRQKRTLRSHRASYEINVGPIPCGMFVCHRCDNPPCVNPRHLFLGTAKDNTRDMISKGRYVRPKTLKLSPGDIVHIKRAFDDGMSQSDIAKVYGVSRVTINRVVNGRIWKAA